LSLVILPNFQRLQYITNSPSHAVCDITNATNGQLHIVQAIAIFPLDLLGAMPSG
jgi:hypothetical protein